MLESVGTRLIQRFKPSSFPRRFKGVYPGSRIGRWIREVGDIDFLRAECEGVKGKAESDARMSCHSKFSASIFHSLPEGIRSRVVRWKK